VEVMLLKDPKTILKKKVNKEIQLFFREKKHSAFSTFTVSTSFFGLKGEKNYPKGEFY
jgi:hypothetical protein